MFSFHSQVLLVLAFTCVAFGLPHHHADHHVTSKPSSRESKDIKLTRGDGVLLKLVELEPGVFLYTEDHSGPVVEPSTTMMPPSADDELVSDTSYSEGETKSEEAPESSQMEPLSSEIAKVSSGSVESQKPKPYVGVRPKLQEQQIQIQSQGSQPAHGVFLPSAVASLTAGRKVRSSVVQKSPMVSAASLPETPMEKPEERVPLTPELDEGRNYLIASALKSSLPGIVPEEKDEITPEAQSVEMLQEKDAHTVVKEPEVSQPSVATVETVTVKDKTDLQTAQMIEEQEHVIEDQQHQEKLVQEQQHQEKVVQEQQIAASLNPAIQPLSQPRPVGSDRRQHARKIVVEPSRHLKDNVLKRKRAQAKDQSDRNAVIIKEDRVEHTGDGTNSASYETSAGIKYEQKTELDADGFQVTTGVFR